jgi:hypothetical protein
VEYLEAYPFPFNNFIYKVTLSPAPAPEGGDDGSALQGRKKRQSCTVPLPADVPPAIIVRLSNSKAMDMNNANRVENEVAAMHLARKAVNRLSSGSSSSSSDLAGIIPAVYAWKTTADPSGVADHQFGWTVMEYMPGVPLDEQFKTFSHEDKSRVVDQVARVLAALQAIEFPAGVDLYGGLTIDEGCTGIVRSGQSPLLVGGPFGDYAAFSAAKLRAQLEQADGSEAVKGWHEGGLRERIDRFVDT